MNIQILITFILDTNMTYDMINYPYKNIPYKVNFFFNVKFSDPFIVKFSDPFIVDIKKWCFDRLKYLLKYYELLPKEMRSIIIDYYLIGVYDDYYDFCEKKRYEFLKSPMYLDNCFIHNEEECSFEDSVNSLSIDYISGFYETREFNTIILYERSEYDLILGYGEHLKLLNGGDVVNLVISFTGALKTIFLLRQIKTGLAHILHFYLKTH